MYQGEDQINHKLPAAMVQPILYAETWAFIRGVNLLVGSSAKVQPRALQNATQAPPPWRAETKLLGPLLGPAEPVADGGLEDRPERGRDLGLPREWWWKLSPAAATSWVAELAARSCFISPKSCHCLRANTKMLSQKVYTCAPYCQRLFSFPCHLYKCVFSHHKKCNCKAKILVLFQKIAVYLDTC